MVRSGSIRFWLSLSFLNSLLVLCVPGQARWWTYVTPSLDLVALAMGWVLLGAWGKRLPRAARAILVVYFWASGLLRLADGVEQGAYLRNFVPSVDLPLLPELVRLFRATLPVPVFWLACTAVSALGIGAGYLVLRAFEVSGAELASAARARSICSFVGGLALLSAVGVPLPCVQPSMSRRWAAELRGALELPRQRAKQLARIARVGQTLAARPHDLLRLRGRNVYLFLIESYGQSVLDRPELSERVVPEYRRWERELAAVGFQIASRVLDSPVYGGRSWLAQATLLTGVATHDQLEFELLRETQPRTLAQLFSAAGYRTVLAQPGTVRADDARDLLHFEQRYVASAFGYRGPRFGWATMPDQFVIDMVRRRELSAAPERPLFLSYALVSSHVPWSDLPPIVADWSTLGDGSLFDRLPRRHYDTSWLSLAGAGAGAAYADSVVYDLGVLRRYLAEFVTDDSLVVILGDHQPHSDVTRREPSPGVPVHVLSRNSAFVAPFRARGYTAGMLAEEALPHPELGSLLPDLVADFSVGSARSER